MENKLSLALVALALLGLQSCGLFRGTGGGLGDAQGELKGYSFLQNEPEYQITIPYGMVAVPAGTFHMGQTDEDITHSQINQNKQVTIGGFYMDDTEITNDEYEQFFKDIAGAAVDGSGSYSILFDFTLLNENEKRLLQGIENPGYDRLKELYYPDTLSWKTDYTHHLGDPLQEYYFWHPAFNNYPVVGITWDQAKVFCLWRTKFLNDYRSSNGEWAMPNFRLPSEAEWEYAARGGRDLAKYPWGNPYIRNEIGCLVANFKPGRGNYYDDGYAYTAPVGFFIGNGYGLYDMAGNVSEWVEDAYNPAAMPLVWDLNPTYFDENEPRKVIRGGSWKDVAFYLRTGARTYEYKDSTKTYIGFRCAMTNLGRSSGYDFGTP